ncbi:MAG: AraC family transcriptional regulator [Lentimonas sp.]
MDDKPKKINYSQMESVHQKERTESLISNLLRAKGLSFEELDEVPVSDLRYTLRGGVPGMRVTHLAAELRKDFLQRPFTSELLCMRAGWHQAIPSHYLPRPEGSYDTILIYCSKGCGWVELFGKTWIIQKNMAALIPSHVPHAYGADTEDPWEVYWVHFQGTQAKAYEAALREREGEPVLHISQFSEFRICFEQVYQHMSRVHTYPTLVAASGALAQLLGLIYSLMRVPEVRSKSAEELLDKSIEFMHANLSKRLSIAELASVAAMNPNYYTTLFSKQFSHPPIEYFNRLKVQRACELLKSTDLRISEISEQLGVADPYYFSRLFKKVMGVSPNAYRD